MRVKKEINQWNSFITRGWVIHEPRANYDWTCMLIIWKITDIHWTSCSKACVIKLIFNRDKVNDENKVKKLT